MERTHFKIQDIKEHIEKYEEEVTSNLYQQNKQIFSYIRNDVKKQRNASNSEDYVLRPFVVRPKVHNGCTTLKVL